MKPLRQRLNYALGAALAALGIAAGTVLYFFMAAHLLREFDYALAAKARSLTSFAEAGRTGVNLQFTEAALPEFAAGGPEFYEASLGATLLARSPSLNNVPLVPQGRDVRDVKLQRGHVARAITLRFAGEGENDLTVTIARLRSPLDAKLRALVLGIVAGGLALITVAIYVTHRVVGFGLRPLSTLAANVQQASFNSRIEQSGVPTELQPIVSELNRLLHRLESVFERERRFTSDVAHELTTPIAELRALTDVALRWPDDPAATTLLPEKAAAITRQMEKTVRILLALARSQSGCEQVKVERVDIRGLLEDAWRFVEPKTRARQIAIHLDLPSLFLKTDAAMMRAILFNLAENAADYTPPNGSVFCECTRSEIVIRNTQSALTAEDLPKMFEPFWRKDPARADSQHAGLGLALVQSYAGVLGMTVTAELLQDRMLQMKLHFSDHITST